MKKLKKALCSKHVKAYTKALKNVRTLTMKILLYFKIKYVFIPNKYSIFVFIS